MGLAMVLREAGGLGRKAVGLPCKLALQTKEFGGEAVGLQGKPTEGLGGGAQDGPAQQANSCALTTRQTPMAGPAVPVARLYSMPEHSVVLFGLNAQVAGQEAE